MQINDLVQRLNAKQTGNNQYAAHCPAHDDKTPSLSIATGDDGRILLHCQAGCPLENIIWALGITSQDLFPSKSELSKLEAEYIYFDDQGNEILKKGKIRKSTGEKTFFWEHKENDGWVKGMNNIVPPLYNQNALKTGQAAVFIVEGEKDVDTLKKLGIIAVSSPHGAGNGKNKWLPEYSQKLKGFDVIILQDNDKPGKEFAKDVALNLLDIAKSVKVIDLTNTWSGLKEHGDISDVFELESEKQTVIAKLKKLVTDTPLFIKIEPDKKSVEKLSVISAIDLQNKDLPPLRFIVNGMLAQGLALLVSPPKFGKSWMSLDLCLSVAAGKPFLNHNTQKGSVLYLALEDSERRLQDRMNKLLCGKTAPAGFNYSTKSKDTANGLIDQIETYLEEYPETSLIVIDTLQKIRGPANGKDSAYSADYKEIGVIKNIADKHEICILLIHHTRKAKSDGDSFERISGTNAILGAADVAFMLTKENRTDDQTLLSIVSRDIEPSDTVLEFDKTAFRWKVLGDANWLEQERARLEYQNSPIILTIKKLLEQNADGWSGSAKELLEAAKYIAKTYVSKTPKELANKLQSFEKPLFEYDKICHSRVKNGSGGGIHKFYYIDNLPDF